jgi:hypothetical protein
MFPCAMQLLSERNLNNLISVVSFETLQMDVMEVALDKTGSAVERRLAIVDKNRDLYLTQVRIYGSARKTVKLGLLVFNVDCLLWPSFISTRMRKY